MSGQLMALLIPLVLVWLVLFIIALRDLIRRRRVVGSYKWLWAAVVLLAGLLGLLVYFLVGRKKEE